VTHRTEKDGLGLRPREGLKITLPLPPNIANGRMHWRTKHARRTAYVEQAKMWLLLRDFTLPSWYSERLPLPLAELGATLYLHSLMDDDGALSRLKWPIDVLVRQGYLVDDSRKHCRMTIPEQVIERDKSRQKVEITLTPIEGQPKKERRSTGLIEASTEVLQL
jgi:hypothetical protein